MTMRSAASLPHSKTLNGATSQLDRLRGAPSPDDVQVDGRSLAQLLAFAARFGSLVTFYDLTNRPLGDWSVFFLSDPAVASALHGSLDLPEIATGLRGLLDELRRAEDHRGSGPSLVRVAAAIVHLIQIHDKDAASDLPAPTRLTGLAGRDRRDPLGEPMRRLRRTLSGRDLTLWIAEIGDGRHGDWLDGLLDILEELIAILIEELERGAEQALAQAEASLATPGHAPQAALYNAFALLFDEARHAMNRLPRRLLDFYYGDILKQHSRKAVPDRLYLVFTLATGATRASVPKGTRFSAGTDPQGLAIEYAAEDSLEVTAASVSSLAVQQVLFQDADGQGGRSEATGILTGTVAAGDDGSLPAAPFPAFGGSAATATGSLTMQPASIGFAVMANALMLCGGDRSVSLSLQFKTSGDGQNDGQNGDSGGDGGGSGESIADAIAQSFSFYYSTAGGWMLIDASTLSIVQQTADTIVIDFALPADAPPLVTLSTEPAADALPPTLPDTAFPGVGTLPTVLAQLRSVSAGSTQSSVTGYFLLSRVSVSTVSIAVEVTGLPPDGLSSPSGQLDPSQTFGLFGSPPVQNATLSITAAELFVKQVTALSLSVDWSGLPVTTTGFLGYYRGYVLDADGNRPVQPLFDNGSFRVTLGVASPGGWTLPAATPLYLFQTAQPAATGTPDVGSADASIDAPAGVGPGAAPAAGTAVLPTSVLTAPSVQAVETSPYYNPSSSALLLTLVEPSYAFGDVLYSSNLTAAADTNIATVQARSQQSLVSTLGGSSGQIAKASKVNASASGKDYAGSVGEAVSNAVSALNGDALAALQQAVAQSGADADGQSALLQSLQAALEGRGTSGSSSRRSRWSGGGGKSAAGSVTAGLSAWLADHQGDLAQADGALLQKARSALVAAGSLDGSLTAAKGQSDSVARPSIAAALQNALVKIQSGNLPASQSAVPSAGTGGATGGATAQATSGTRITVPNPPWQPNATALTISYSATEVTPLITVEETVSGDTADDDSGGGDSFGGDTAVSAQLALSGDGPFWHLDLFRQTTPAHDGRSVPLLPSIPPRAALYIDLSAAVSTASLLIVLQASSGGWTTEQPRVLWEQKVGRAWRPARLLSDSTNDLMNTGIVSLQLFPPTPAQETTSLRVTLVTGMDQIPYVKSVTTNALTARWIGPGGAEQLGTPLPAGTVTQSVETIDGIGGIDQPEDSEGGSPLAVGPEFDLWMSERLRHKGFAIDGWDYARLVLADFPSLWQVAVVPATDGGTGRPAPGHVWVVAVAGPLTPNVSDKTEPMVSPSLLADIGELLETVTSPFVTIRVTNPPYVRLTVVADVVFSGDDTATAYEERLSGELVEWLSPWPSPGLGLRPSDYYSREAIADFVRNRPYVRAVPKLRTETDGGNGPGGWSYLTSATAHKIHGMTDGALPAAGKARR